MSLQPKLQKRLRGAIKHFWNTRETQAQRQGKVSGSRMLEPAPQLLVAPK